MLSNENGSTNTLAGSYYVDLKKKKKTDILEIHLPRKKSHGYVSLPSNQTRNKHFVCSLSVADLFVFAGIDSENPVPESDIKILPV